MASGALFVRGGTEFWLGTDHDRIFHVWSMLIAGIIQFIILWDWNLDVIFAESLPDVS